MIENVAVIGAGLMGHGIAQVFAGKGCSVVLYDIQEDRLTEALENIRSNLELFLEMGLETETFLDRILSRIRVTTNLGDAVKEAGFVLEAVPEDLNLKIEVFREIDRATPEDVILASNTSSLPITEIGQAIQKSDRLVMTHWFNPPHLIPVVEVVRGEATSEATFQRTFHFLEAMGKEPVEVRKQVPGLLVNRIQTAMFREIIGLLEAGVASPEDLDKAVSGSFGLRLAAIGPLATVDLAGVDLWFKGSKNLYPLFDNSPEPQKLLQDLVEKGHHGIKTGKGFFEYPASGREARIRERDKQLISLQRLLHQGQ